MKDLADARTQALAGAKEIHTFDRDALDTKERVQVIYIDDSAVYVYHQKLYISGVYCVYIWHVIELV